MTNKTDQLTPRRRPRQERSRERVERILDATAALLGDDMPADQITTAAIAEEAGVPIGSVYQYFPNKLAVLAELARRVMEQVDNKTASLIAEDFGVRFGDPKPVRFDVRFSRTSQYPADRQVRGR